MTKFNKFLEEDNYARKNTFNENKSLNETSGSTSYKSTKIYTKTSEKIRVVKSATQKNSAAEVIDDAIELYINSLPAKTRNVIEVLLNRD